MATQRIDSCYHCIQFLAGRIGWGIIQAGPGDLIHTRVQHRHTIWTQQRFIRKYTESGPVHSFYTRESCDPFLSTSTARRLTLSQYPARMGDPALHHPATKACRHICGCCAIFGWWVMRKCGWRGGSPASGRQWWSYSCCPMIMMNHWVVAWTSRLAFNMRNVIVFYMLIHVNNK